MYAGTLNSRLLHCPFDMISYVESRFKTPKGKLFPPADHVWDKPSHTWKLTGGETNPEYYLGLRREKGANLSPSCERDASVRPYSSTEVQQIWSLSVAAAAFSIAHRRPPSEGASTVGVPLWEADCNSVREATLTLCDNCDLKPCPVKGDRAAALAALEVWRRENRAAGR